MSRVVLVHGAFNELWGPHQIAQRWIPALRDGLWHHGVDVSPDDVECAFYGDLFRLDPDGGEAVDPAELAQRSGLVDVLNSIPGMDQLGTLAHAVGEAANQRMLDQVGRFLAAGDVRHAVRDRVDRVLGPDTEVVVAHSLGTLVSYEILAARSELSPALVTMGSPLAGPFVFDQLRPAPVDGVGAWPGSVRSWTNIAAVGDPACGGRGLSGPFGADVIDHMVDNGHRAHDPEPYLNAQVTGAAVAAALGLL